MFFIHELRPTLIVQSDSMRAYHKFLIGFPLVFSLYVFIVCLHPLNFYTSYVHMYIYIY